MNYFELYDLPITFNPNQKLVKQKFYSLSKKYHPDFYINEDQAKQDEVLELSTLKIEIIKQQVNDLVLDLGKELANLTSNFESASVDEQNKLLVAIKDIYFRNKYLSRIKESIVRIST